jgi:hypothetical protein
MDINMQKRNEVLAQNVIKGLESRNMSGYYAADREAAVKQALESRRAAVLPWVAAQVLMRLD